MLASINPLGERARNQHYPIDRRGLHRRLDGRGRDPRRRLGFVGAPLARPDVALVAVARTGDRRDRCSTGAAFGLRVPGPRRQVDENWLVTYRGWVYGAGFGAQLGLAFVTIVTASATWVAFACALFSGVAPAGAVDRRDLRPCPGAPDPGRARVSRSVGAAAARAPARTAAAARRRHDDCGPGRGRGRPGRARGREGGMRQLAAHGLALGVAAGLGGAHPAPGGRGGGRADPRGRAPRELRVARAARRLRRWCHAGDAVARRLRHAVRVRARVTRHAAVRGAGRAAGHAPTCSARSACNGRFRASSAASSSSPRNGRPFCLYVVAGSRAYLPAHHRRGQRGARRPGHRRRDDDRRRRSRRSATASSRGRRPKRIGRGSHPARASWSAPRSSAPRSPSTRCATSCGPGTAYAALCGPDASCSSGWTAFCCTVNGGQNTCPPGSMPGGMVEGRQLVVLPLGAALLHRLQRVLRHVRVRRQRRVRPRVAAAATATARRARATSGSRAATSSATGSATRISRASARSCAAWSRASRRGTSTRRARPRARPRTRPRCTTRRACTSSARRCSRSARRPTTASRSGRCRSRSSASRRRPTGGGYWLGRVRRRGVLLRRRAVSTARRAVSSSTARSSTSRVPRRAPATGWSRPTAASSVSATRASSARWAVSA